MDFFKAIKERASKLLFSGKITPEETKNTYKACTVLDTQEATSNTPFFDVITLSLFLGISAQELSELRHTGCDSMYSTFYIDKKSHKVVPYNYPGKLREINAPSDTLKSLQKKLIPVFANFKTHPANNGFVAGKNILDAVKAVKDGETLIHVDLNKFFDNHKKDYVKARLVEKFKETYGTTLDEETIESLLALLLRKGRLPQGAPTSPCLVVSLNYELDSKIQELAAKYGLAYSRYADDLAFSGTISYINSKQFIRELKTTITPFTINFEKLKVMRTKSKSILKYVLFKSSKFTNKMLKNILTVSAEEFGDLKFQAISDNEYTITSENMSTLSRDDVEAKLNIITTKLQDIPDLTIKPKFFYIQSTKHLLGLNIVDGNINYPRKDYENLRLISLLLGRQRAFQEILNEIEDPKSVGRPADNLPFTVYNFEASKAKLLNILEMFSSLYSINKIFHRNLLHDGLDEEHFMGIISHVLNVDQAKGNKLRSIINASHDKCYDQIISFVDKVDKSNLKESIFKIKEKYTK